MTDLSTSIASKLDNRYKYNIGMASPWNTSTIATVGQKGGRMWTMAVTDESQTTWNGVIGRMEITMMFSVSDILKLNPFTRKILANAAAAACGMAEVETKFAMEKGDKLLIGMSNLGVLTNGAMHSIEYIESKGYELIVFHAVG